MVVVVHGADKAQSSSVVQAKQVAGAGGGVESGHSGGQRAVGRWRAAGGL